MSAGYHHFIIEQGATFGQTLTLKDNSDTLVNLVGYTSAEMDLRDNPEDSTTILTLTTSNGRIALGGTAGTVTTIAGVDMCLPRYNRSRVDGYWLGFDAVERVSRFLSGQSYEERAAHPCIGYNRADLVVAGCAVLEAVCRIWPAGQLRVADRGVREGILSVMSGQPKAICDDATAFAVE